jgi:hypothetical protein
LQNYTWKAVVPVDTTSYRYAWRVDGALKSATSRSFTTYHVSGQPKLTSMIIRTDQSRDSATWTLKVLPIVSIQGPAEVRPADACVWNAYVSGGTPPYQYSWRLNGTPVGNNSNIYSAQMPASTNQLDVTVTDGLSSIATSQVFVWVHSSYPECLL